MARPAADHALRLFRSRERSGAYAARILFLGAMLGLWFFITQFLQGVYGYSPLEAGRRLPADTPYLTGVALPMILIGGGQGGSLSPLTASGIAGVAPEDAGAASGLVNVAHQLGGSLGLGILVTVFAAAGSDTLNARDLLAQRVGTTLAAGSVMLALALTLVAVLIVPIRSTAAGRVATQPPESFAHNLDQ